jgi:hypothetical protein
LLGKPDGKRKTGRLKLRWIDCYENELQFEVERCQEMEEESRIDIGVCVCVCVWVWYHSEGSTAQIIRTVCQQRRRRRRHIRSHTDNLMLATNNFYATKLADKPTSPEISQITANKNGL